MKWRRLARLMGIAGLIWLFGVLLGLLPSVPSLSNIHSSPKQVNPTVWGIFSNNLLVLIGCFMGLFTCSLASIIALIANGIFFGLQLQIFAKQIPSWKLLTLLAPHGLLEMPGIFLAGAIGMMGGNLLFSCFRSGVSGIRPYYRPVLIGIFISVALVLLGAIIESWSISRL
jgi:uncharacterized membrane protein SpoIIM required for sporulation